MTEGPRTDEAGPNVDPAGAPVEDAGFVEETAPPAASRSGRVLDRGAIFAGWVGLGMAVVIAMSFGLIITVQVLVLMAAPIAGMLIGYYANQRSERFRPRWRLFVNAGYAGLVTGIGLALMYVPLRLLFAYADFGFRPEPMGGQLACETGLACTYARHIALGNREALEAVGITDVASFEASFLAELFNGAIVMIALALAGALLAAALRAVRKPPQDAPDVAAPEAVAASS